MKTMRRARSAIRIEQVQQTKLFANCTKDELRIIASLTTMKDVASGAVLAEQGKVGREFFVVTEGSATASRNGEWLAELGPGSFFGELALLDGGPRTATVVADTDMTLLVLSRTEFKSLQFSAPVGRLQDARRAGGAAPAELCDERRCVSRLPARRRLLVAGPPVDVRPPSNRHRRVPSATRASGSTPTGSPP